MIDINNDCCQSSLIISAGCRWWCGHVIWLTEGDEGERAGPRRQRDSATSISKTSNLWIVLHRRDPSSSEQSAPLFIWVRFQRLRQWDAAFSFFIRSICVLQRKDEGMIGFVIFSLANHIWHQMRQDHCSISPGPSLCLVFFDVSVDMEVPSYGRTTLWIMVKDNHVCVYEVIGPQWSISLLLSFESPAWAAAKKE